MKVVLLAGGYGTRISEYTDSIPKPLIPIGGKPIVWYIMQRYASYGHKDFFLALGYKSEKIKEYFLNYKTLNSDFKVDFRSGDISSYADSTLDWSVSLIDTGLETMTGGRVKRLKKYINNETFMMTYGDGLSNINIDSLIKFHKSHGKLVTVTAVRPPARFGELEIFNTGQVNSFTEKSQLHSGWINGGYFVIEPEFLDFISSDSTMLEREPLETIAKSGNLMAYSHDGFWQCMDTKRDLTLLEDMYASGFAPWINE